MRSRGRIVAVGLAAVLLAVAINSLATGGSLKSTVKKAVRKEVAKQINKATGPRGEPGPQGTQGAQGPQGPAGSPAAGLLTGFIEESDMPYGSNGTFVPVGDSVDSSENSINANAPTVLRDLSVQIDTPPGIGTGWDIRVGGTTAATRLSCSINGSFAATCNSGSQAVTVPAGARIELNITNGLPAANGTALRYGYRALSP
jgi:hypothetical protein